MRRAFLEDSAGSLSLADAQPKTFTPYEGPLQRGFSPSVFWVRLDLRGRACQRPVPGAPGVCADRWVVRVQPSNLDEITLFDSLTPQAPPLIAGDRHPLALQEYTSLNQNFVIPASAEPRAVWLRLKTTNTKLMNLQVLPFDEALRADQRQMLATGFVVSTLAIFMAWAALQWWVNRERLIGLMAVTQLVTLLYALAYMGYIRLMVGDQVPATWQDQFTNLLVATSTPAQIWFHRNFLRELGAPRFGLRVLSGLLCLYPLELLALALGHTREALQANSMQALLVPPIVMAIAWRVPRPNAVAGAAGDAVPPVFSRGVLFAFYGAMLAVIWLSILPILGVSWHGAMTVYSLPVYGFLNGLMLVVILQMRTAHLRALHRRAQTNLQLAQQRVESEVAQRRTQSQFMAMLTHELKTPLAVLRMALGLASGPDDVKARADRAIQDMTAVIDRCALATTLEDRGLAPSKSACDVTEVLTQVIAGLDDASRVRLDAADASSPIQTDPPLLRIVLANLLDNARKYAPPDSPIQVRLRPQAAEGAAGIGITVENLPGRAGWPDAARVFQRYYRSAAARHQSGSGLGLYLAGTLAERLGGVLRYAPSDTHVRFDLWLPL